MAINKQTFLEGLGKAKAFFDTKIKSVVTVSDTQPNDEYNQIWINSGSEEIEIPTMAELQAAKDKVDKMIVLNDPDSISSDAKIVFNSDGDGYVELLTKDDLKDIAIGQGILSDVKIAGESVVENGIANVPIADTNGYGVVSVRDSRGINITDYVSGDVQRKILCTVRAVNDDIKTRTNIYKPIVPYNLDYAVKTSLSDCKLEWTPTEKLATKTLLGIGKALADVTMTETVGSVTLNIPPTTKRFRIMGFVANMNENGVYVNFTGTGNIRIKGANGSTVATLNYTSTTNCWATSFYIDIDRENMIGYKSPTTKYANGTNPSHDIIASLDGTYTNQYGGIIPRESINLIGFGETFNGSIVIEQTSGNIGIDSRFIIYEL